MAEDGKTEVLADAVNRLAHAVSTLCDEVIPADAATKALMATLLAQLKAMWPFLT